MDQGQPIESLDSGSAEQEITGRIGGDRHLGLDLDDFDCVKRNGAHLRDHAFTFTILQATVEYCASWLFLLLFAAKYEPATSLGEGILCRRWIGGAPRHPAEVFRGFGEASQERANAAPTPAYASPRNLERSACA